MPFNNDVNFSCIEGDVRNKEFLVDSFGTHGVDVVIHCAGYKATRESFRLPVDYYSNNVGGTINLLEAMKEVKLKRLIFSSRASVYGNPQYLPVDEEHPIALIW